MFLVLEQPIEQHEADDSARQHRHAHEEALVSAATVHGEVVVGFHSPAALLLIKFDIDFFCSLHTWT